MWSSPPRSRPAALLAALMLLAFVAVSLLSDALQQRQQLLLPAQQQSELQQQQQQQLEQSPQLSWPVDLPLVSNLWSQEWGLHLDAGSDVMRALYNFTAEADIDRGGFNYTGLCHPEAPPAEEGVPRRRRYRTAILVPFRDRLAHLAPFLAYMHPFLQRQCLHYQIYFISQSFDGRPFNRGALINAGFSSFVNKSAWDCVVVHDVDLLPVRDENLYRCSGRPRLLNVASSRHNFRPYYAKYFGGVVAVAPATFARANGFSNAFFGWGGEDDDVASRMRGAVGGRSLDRNTEHVGRYVALKHPAQPANEDRFKQIEEGKKVDLRRKGLSTVNFRVLSGCDDPDPERFALFKNCTVELLPERDLP